MTMVKRDDISEKQITEAKQMPGATADKDDDRGIDDSELSGAAGLPATGTPPAGVPSRLPGYRR